MNVWNLVDDIQKEKEVNICLGKVTCCEVSEEGLYLGVGTEKGRACIYNLRYFDLESEKQCHQAKVEAVSFTNDSRYMFTVAKDCSYHFLSLMK